MSMNEGAMMNVMVELMPILEKYGSVTPKFLNIKVEKFEEGVVIKLQSDEQNVTEALSEILVLMSKMNTETKINCEVVDKRANKM